MKKYFTFDYFSDLSIGLWLYLYYLFIFLARVEIGGWPAVGHPSYHHYELDWSVNGLFVGLFSLAAVLFLKLLKNFYDLKSWAYFLPFVIAPSFFLFRPLTKPLFYSLSLCVVLFALAQAYINCKNKKVNTSSLFFLICSLYLVIEFFVDPFQNIGWLLS